MEERDVTSQDAVFLPGRRYRSRYSGDSVRVADGDPYLAADPFRRSTFGPVGPRGPRVPLEPLEVGRSGVRRGRSTVGNRSSGRPRPLRPGSAEELEDDPIADASGRSPRAGRVRTDSTVPESARPYYVPRRTRKMGFEKLEVGVPAGAVPWGVHRCGRMEERNERGRAPSPRAAGRLRHRGRLRIERSQGMGAERHDHSGWRIAETCRSRNGRHVRAARRWNRLSGRPALDDVQDAELSPASVRASRSRGRAVDRTGPRTELRRASSSAPGASPTKTTRGRGPAPIGHDVASGR